MKKLLLIFFSATIFLSCSSNSNDSSSAVASGTFKYKVNGNLVTIDNANIANGEYAFFFKELQGNMIPHTRYKFNGRKGGNVWFFGIQSDSLSNQTYIYDSTYFSTSGIICTMTFNGKQSALLYSGDNLTIKITSYANSLISGNFSAKFTPLSNNYSNKGTTIIKDGEFKNINCTF
ncbi:MAG: hypothetical protein ABI374_12840 [Ginsengibacter sp.]